MNNAPKQGDKGQIVQFSNPTTAQPIRNVTPFFSFGYHGHPTYDTGSLDATNDAACFVIEVVFIFAKIRNSGEEDSMQTIPIAIFPSESPEKLISI